MRMLGRIALLVAGMLAFAVAVRALIAPNQLLSGGVAGTALLLNRLFGLPIGLCWTVLNLPIFLLGFRHMGRRFALLSGAAVIALWPIIDLLPVPTLTEDRLLAAVFGGVLGGIGTSLGLRSGGSLGGFDILGVVLNRRFGLGVGEALQILNGALIVAAGLTGNAEIAMYTLVGIFATGWTIDALQTPRPRKAFLIVTAHAEPIRARILAAMRRGVTLLPAIGGFGGGSLTALLCVVTRAELRELSDLVRAEDPEAFVVVLEASEVMGHFRSALGARVALRRLAAG